MLGWLRREWPKGHPTPEQAHAALRAGRCMYAEVNKCSGGVRSVGLRNNDDVSAVLTCKAHYGRLRKLNDRDAERLERELLRAFGRHGLDYSVGTGAASHVR